MLSQSFKTVIVYEIDPLVIGSNVSFIGLQMYTSKKIGALERTNCYPLSLQGGYF